MAKGGNIRDSVEQHGVMRKKTNRVRSTYSRFFEGYETVAVKGKNGKMGIKRVYTGDYYRQALPDARFWSLKAFYLAAYLLAVAAFVFAGLKPAAVNGMLYAAFLQAVSVFFFGWLFIALFEYIPARRKLTVYEYKSSSKSLIRASLGLSLCMAFLCAGAALYLLVHIREAVAADWICTFGYLAAALLAAAMRLTEQKIPYEKTASGAQE